MLAVNPSADGESRTFCGDEEAQHVVFLGREFHLRALEGDDAAHEIDGEIAAAEDRGLALCRSIALCRYFRVCSTFGNGRRKHELPQRSL